jgi:hypothetical protein
MLYQNPLQQYRGLSLSCSTVATLSLFGLSLSHWPTSKLATLAMPNWDAALLLAIDAIVPQFTNASTAPYLANVTHLEHQSEN